LAIDANIRRKLQRADWRAIGLRLTAHAAWRAANLHWRRGDPVLLAGGKTAEDIAMEVIEKVLAGERRWDPERGELLPYMCGVADSLVSHLAESHDNRTYAELDPDVDYAATPPADAATSDSQRINDLRALLRREGQLDLLEVIDAVTLHCDPTPQALAESLRTSTADINNRLKRLRRRALRMVNATAPADETEGTNG
jgi:DNA-directed RNA polymerase specialized sigma24 family protein